MKILAALALVIGLAWASLGADIPGTVVAAKITTGNDANTFSIGDTGEMAGTPKQVATIVARDAIPTARRVEGMTCWVIAENAEYRLVGGTANANWTLSQYLTNVVTLYATNTYIEFITNNWMVTTNLYATNVYVNYFTNNYSFVTNLFVTNAYVNNFTNNYSFITNLYATNVYVNFFTNNYAFITNLYATNTYIEYLTNNYLYTTNLYATNVYVNFFTNNYAFITNLYATNTYIEFLTNNYLYTTNLYATNVYINYFTNNWMVTTNLYATNTYVLYFTNYYAYITNITAKEMWITNITVYWNIGFITNAWDGPTNNLPMWLASQDYETATDCSITNILGVSNNVVQHVLLTISNSAATDVTLRIPAQWRTGDGARSYVITNAGIGLLSVEYNPNGGRTNAIFRFVW